MQTGRAYRMPWLSLAFSQRYDDCRSLAAALSLPYPLLADTHGVATQFGVRNQGGSLRRAAFVVDQRCRVQVATVFDDTDGTMPAIDTVLRRPREFYAAPTVLGIGDVLPWNVLVGLAVAVVPQRPLSLEPRQPRRWEPSLPTKTARTLDGIDAPERRTR